MTIFYEIIKKILKIKISSLLLLTTLFTIISGLYFLIHQIIHKKTLEIFKTLTYSINTYKEVIISLNDFLLFSILIIFFILYILFFIAIKFDKKFNYKNLKNICYFFIDIEIILININLILFFTDGLDFFLLSNCIKQTIIFPFYLIYNIYMITSHLDFKHDDTFISEPTIQKDPVINKKTSKSILDNSNEHKKD